MISAVGVIYSYVHSLSLFCFDLIIEFYDENILELAYF